MNITRKSQVSGIVRTLNLPITQEQLDNWHQGALVQNAFPNLTADQREFLMTGITAEEWDEMFAGEEE
jgi:hypothetical protein